MSRPHLILPEFTEQQIKNFWDRVAVKGPDECWEWLGAKAHYGHGRYIVAPTRTSAHRVAYYLTHKVDPGELFACHKCDNPPCCNPAHLFLGTHADNMGDAKRKGRTPSGLRNGMYTHPESRSLGDKNGARLHPERLKRGDGSPWAKITTAQARQVKAMLAEKRHKDRIISELTNVPIGTVRDIKYNKCWRHA